MNPASVGSIFVISSHGVLPGSVKLVPEAFAPDHTFGPSDAVRATQAACASIDASPAMTRSPSDASQAAFAPANPVFPYTQAHTNAFNRAETRSATGAQRGGSPSWSSVSISASAA